MITISTKLFSDGYILLMNENDDVCRHMHSLYNSDLRENDNISFKKHKEYNWLNWDKQVSLKNDDINNQPEKFGINSFDINNDGKDERVLFKRTYFNWKMLTLHDELHFFPLKDEINYSSVEKSSFYKMANHTYFISSGGYKLIKFPKQGNASYLSLNDYYIRPFKIKNQYYFSLFGDIGINTKSKEAKQTNGIVISQYDTNNILRDICYLMRPKPNESVTREQKLKQLSQTLRRIESAPDERYQALKKLNALLPYDSEYFILRQYYNEISLKDKDSRVRRYAMNNLWVNEKTIPMLLNLIVNDCNDKNKITATFKIANYFTCNGCDPTQYGYVIDKHIDLATKAYNTLKEVDARGHGTKEMQNTMYSIIHSRRE